MIECKTCKFYVGNIPEEECFYCKHPAYHNYKFSFMSNQITGCEFGKPIKTKFERFSRMTEDEIIAFLLCNGCCPNFGNCECGEDCENCWKEYFKKPYEDGDFGTYLQNI